MDLRVWRPWQTRRGGTDRSRNPSWLVARPAGSRVSRRRLARSRGPSKVALVKAAPVYVARVNVAGSCRHLLPLLGSEIQILIVETEIRQGRYRLHREMIDAPVRLQRKGQESILNRAVPPVHLKGVELPVL